MNYMFQKPTKEAEAEARRMFFQKPTKDEQWAILDGWNLKRKWGAVAVSVS